MARTGRKTKQEGWALAQPPSSSNLDAATGASEGDPDPVNSQIAQLEKKLEAPLTGQRTVDVGETAPRIQKSREGKKAYTMYMTRDAHKALKIYLFQNEMSIADFVHEAMNEKLEKDGAEFRIG